MKTKLFFLIVFVTCCYQYTIAQTAGISDIGIGYFNGHQYASFGTISGTPPTLTGSLAGNAFTINFSNNTRSVFRLVSNYGPNVPANSGTFSAPFMELNYSSVPAINTITFANSLQPLDAMHVVDIELGESVTFEFLNASGIPVSIANNIRVVSLSNITPTASLNYPSSTMVGINTAPNRITDGNASQGFSFVMLTNIVNAIRFTQVNSTAGGGSWDFTFSSGTPDRGDAPSSYGDATHLSLAARLKLGNLGGDAEAATFSGNAANGDDASSGSTIIDDEDGISSVPAIANSGVSGEVIPSYSVSATVTNSIGTSANVVAWIDWNGDGIFNESEAAVAPVVPSGSTNASRTFTWTNVELGGSIGLTGTYLRVRTTTGSLTAADAAGFSPDGEVEDYFVPFAVVLPVTMKIFNVTATSNRYVLLDWETEHEQNNTGFNIEHSADGRNWKVIGFVPTVAPGGNSPGTFQYNFTHENPLSGVNYYRLKQIDLDGRGSYSNIRTVNIAADATRITVSPNPVHDAVTIHGVKDDDLITLFNSNGQVLITKKANASRVQLDVSSYTNGVYTILVKTKAGAIQSFKILKK